MTPTLAMKHDPLANLISKRERLQKQIDHAYSAEGRLRNLDTTEQLRTLRAKIGALTVKIEQLRKSESPR